MNDSRSYITLDFRNTHMPVVVKAKRGDTARTLYISLADGGTPYLIADGCYATFTARKPDRTAINNSCTIEGNMIVYPFTEQTCSKEGQMTAEIRLYGSNGRMLTSASFILEIHKTVFGANDVPASEDEMNALDALILETTALKEEVEQKLKNGEFVGEPGPTPTKGKDYWTDADKQEIVNELIASDKFSEIKRDIANLRADFEYTGIKITGISIDQSIAEIGWTLSNVTVYWSLNKVPKTQTVNGENVHLSIKQWSEPNVSSDITFTLRVTDERDAEATASVSIRFLNGVYYGVSEDPETLDSTFILGFVKRLRDTKELTFTVNAAEGQRIWYALPVRLGDCSFAVGGFSGGFDLVGTINFRNNVGYTEPYNVYASAKTGLGETKVVVS